MAVTPTLVLELALRASYTRWPLLFSHSATQGYPREVDLSIDQTTDLSGLCRAPRYPCSWDII